MNRIKILDCTLRDGGYVNDWRFGEDSIRSVIKAATESGVDLVELGFFRNEPYHPDRSIFNDPSQLAALSDCVKKDKVMFAGLIEMANPFPIERICPFHSTAPQAIRYSFWKRLMDEAYEYCYRIKEKGYLLCCQPTRVEQYSYQEFAEMCKRFSKLQPYALYIVDTFGLLDRDSLLEYARVANESLDGEVILGYHAHNNMGQALDNARAFIEQDYNGRVIQLDATVGGIGRGAGNLDMETILRYLNDTYHTNYFLSGLQSLLKDVILPIKREFSWGYNEIYHIVAENRCNPNYASYFLKAGMTASQVKNAVSRIQGPDQYLYADDKAERFKKEAAE